MKKLKGQIQLDKLVMTVLIVAILAAAAALILNEFRDADAMVTSTTVTNESLALVNGTAKELAHPLVTGITQVGNASITVDAANITYTNVGDDYSSVTVTMITTSGDDIFGGTYDVSYTYNDKMVSYNTTNDGLDAVGDVTGWLGIIVIIVIAVFIIFLVRQLGSSSA